MSQINQIQLSFVPIQDRLLLRMNTMESAGFEFWLTRRYVKLLWPVLMNMLQKDGQIALQKTEQAKKEVLSFQHQEATQKMDYTRNYKTQVENKPLGDKPLLLAKISVNTGEDGVQVLSLNPEHGQGIQLSLNQTLLHSICKLLQDTVAKTDWDIDLSQSLSTSTAADVPESRSIN